MSDPPFFQLAGRGDLKFLGVVDGPTVVAWKSLSESEQEQWSKKMGRLCGLVQVEGKRRLSCKATSFPISEVDRKEISSNCSKQIKAKAGA